jgi:hypothetical protein
MEQKAINDLIWKLFSIFQSSRRVESKYSKDIYPGNLSLFDSQTDGIISNENCNLECVSLSSRLRVAVIPVYHNTHLMKT